MGERLKRPSWLKVRMPGSARYGEIRKRASELSLATVCQEAQCPNIGECWGGGTATFMVMGDTCTRGCRFCAVNTSRKPDPLDLFEPVKVATAIKEMALNYVVLTSVDRDDIDDGGAEHFAKCIRAIRHATPEMLVEVLIPDFNGSASSVEAVIAAKPEVIAHNIETVSRLQRSVRDPRANYRQSLWVLEHVKSVDPSRYTKSSIMVGVGERPQEVIECMTDLRAAGCDFLTLGQYLQPTKKHLPIHEYVTPDQFDAYRDIGLEMGFGYVASGPLVRSSYKAGEFFIREFIEKNRADA